MPQGEFEPPLTTKPLTTRDLELICRRGDSNPHELPHTPLKRARLPVPPLRLVREGFQRLNACSGHFLTGAFDGCVSIVDVGIATGAAGVGVAVAAGVGTGACSGTPD